MSVFEPEWLWGSILGIKQDGMEYDEEHDRTIYRWSAAAMRTINDAVTTLDGLRDPRQRGRPMFAGCGRYDGVPGTFPVGTGATRVPPPSSSPSRCCHRSTSGRRIRRAPRSRWSV